MIYPKDDNAYDILGELYARASAPAERRDDMIELARLLLDDFDAFETAINGWEAQTAWLSFKRRLNLIRKAVG